MEQNRLFPRDELNENIKDIDEAITVLGRLYFARQASSLLRFAKSTSNPELAASLIERAADLKAQIDAVEKPIPSPHAPDVEIEHHDAGADGSAGRKVLRPQ